MPFFNTPLTSRPVFTSPLIILALTVSSIFTSAAAGAGPRATGTGTTEPGPNTPAVGKAPKPLKILILGGTGFTGPFQVKYALARGHKVTVFNRGKTHPGELPEGVEQLIGDRNGQLDALKGRKWDVVIDNPTMLPKWVHDAAEILKGNVDRYVFISTISVYADDAKPGMDETAPVAKYDGTDAMKETRDTVIASKFALYGPLKALSEKEVEKWFPGKDAHHPAGIDRGAGRSRRTVSLIGRCGSIAAAKCSRRAIRAIRCSSSMRGTWRNGRSGWRSRARPVFTMRLGRPRP